MKYRIVKGNSFKLHILVSKLYIAKNNNAIVDCNMNNAANIQVALADGYGEETRLKHKVSATAGNELICDFPDTIDVGCYSVRVSFELNGMKLSSCEANMFAVVPFNRQAVMPLGVIDGEPCGMYNLRYFVTTGGEGTMDDYKFWYGSSSAADAADIDTGVLSLETNSASGRTFTIETTDGKPRVWFVCTVPLVITQAGLPTSFNTALDGGLYYYWSDELIAGDDNKYTIYTIGDY